MSEKGNYRSEMPRGPEKTEGYKQLEKHYMRSNLKPLIERARENGIGGAGVSDGHVVDDITRRIREAVNTATNSKIGNTIQHTDIARYIREKF